MSSTDIRLLNKNEILQVLNPSLGEEREDDPIVGTFPSWCCEPFSQLHNQYYLERGMSLHWYFPSWYHPCYSNVATCYHARRIPGRNSWLEESYVGSFSLAGTELGEVLSRLQTAYRQLNYEAGLPLKKKPLFLTRGQLRTLLS